MEIIETFEDTLDDVKKVVGKNGLLYIGLGVVVVFVLVYLSQSKTDSENTVVVASGIASYPDVVTNADVVISSLQNSIDYAQNEIEESIKSNQLENAELFGATNQLITDKANATNNYIQEGFAKQEEIADKHASEIKSTVSKEVETMTNNMYGSFSALNMATQLELEKLETKVNNITLTTPSTNKGTGNVMGAINIGNVDSIRSTSSGNISTPKATVTSLSKRL